MLYLIDISLNPAHIDEAAALTNAHRAWIARQYEAGHLLLAAPFTNETAGMVIIKAESRAELDRILAEDAYHGKDFATVRVREFAPSKIADTEQWL